MQKWNKINSAGKNNRSESGPLLLRGGFDLQRKESNWLNLPEKKGKRCVCPPRPFSFTSSAAVCTELP